LEKFFAGGVNNSNHHVAPFDMPVKKKAPKWHHQQNFSFSSQETTHNRFLLVSPQKKQPKTSLSVTIILHYARNHLPSHWTSWSTNW
jgi:hypothetical protein